LEAQETGLIYNEFNGSHGSTGGSMINVYLNYPNAVATLHQTSDCPRIHQHHSETQRNLIINQITLKKILDLFLNGEFEFHSESGSNDAWLEIDFNDLEFEIAVAKFIVRLLGKKYAPFDRLNIEIHC
jgi:hypothetical protein